MNKQKLALILFFIFMLIGTILSCSKNEGLWILGLVCYGTCLGILIGVGIWATDWRNK